VDWFRHLFEHVAWTSFLLVVRQRYLRHPTAMCFFLFFLRVKVFINGSAALPSPSSPDQMTSSVITVWISPFFLWYTSCCVRSNISQGVTADEGVMESMHLHVELIIRLVKCTRGPRGIRRGCVFINIISLIDLKYHLKICLWNWTILSFN